MKVNSITLKFTDVDDEIASLEVSTDPIVEKAEDLEGQPCLDLANKVILFLHASREQEQQASGGSGTDSKTLH